MSKPVTIGNVLRGLRLGQETAREEQAARLAAVNFRLGALDAEQARRREFMAEREREAIVRLGRCEYQSLRRAQWKEKLYARAVRRDEWDRFQLEKLAARRAERERKKAEWLEFDPESVMVDITRLPEF